MKGAGEKTQTTMPDRDLLRYRNEVFSQARSVASDPYTSYQGPGVAGPNGASGEAAGATGDLARRFASMQFGGGMPTLSAYDQAGATGARALAGDGGATERLMNPYRRQVIDAMGGEFDRMRSKAEMGASDEATRSGAFGGSRHALMTGERLGAIDRAQSSQIADLLHGGFNDAMGRAGQAANLGLGAGDLQSRHSLAAGGLGIDANRAALAARGQQFGMGDYFRGINQSQLDYNRGQFNDQRDWRQRQLQTMMGPLGGAPYGQTTSEPLQRNAFAGAAGGALTGAQVGSLIPGFGTAAGGIVGGLGGLLFG
jgi:hypothetical protein